MSAPAPAKAVGLSDYVSQFLERVDYRRADSAEERDAIYRLRYDAYLSKGVIQPNLNRRFIDAYDSLPNAWTFGVYVDGRLASSFRMHVSSKESPHLPALQVFSDLLAPELEAGKTLIDHTRFVTDPSGNQHPELPYATVRLGYMAAEYFSADIGRCRGSRRTSAFLQAGLRLSAADRSAVVSDADKADHPDGARLSRRARKNRTSLSLFPLDGIRTADAVRAG